MLHARLRAAAGGGWTPDILFASGEKGVWYDVHPSNMFQDAAGTTPVASAGDPVGLLLDLSGNGNHATQSTSARRPVYQTDGLHHWLEFNGTSHCLVSLYATGFSGDIAAIFAAAYATPYTGTDYPGLASQYTGDNGKDFGISVSENRPALDVSGGLYRKDSPSLDANPHSVYIEKTPGQLSVTSLYIDGSLADGGVFGTNLTPNVVNTTLQVGRNADQAGRYFDGKIFAIIYSEGVKPTGDRQQANAYLQGTHP